MIADLDARKRTDLCLADQARLLEVIGAS